MKIHKFSFICGAVLSFFAVLIGAFGAHGFESLLLENDRLNTFETASSYHFFHALALLVIALINPPKPLEKTLFMASVALFGGVIIFSGSLYLLALTNISLLGAVTPVGGLCFLIAWALLIKLGFQWPSQN